MTDGREKPVASRWRRGTGDGTVRAVAWTKSWPRCGPTAKSMLPRAAGKPPLAHSWPAKLDEAIDMIGALA
ncbi:MAG: hypothetical protein WBW81_02275 [Methylocella sp.]